MVDVCYENHTKHTSAGTLCVENTDILNVGSADTYRALKT